MSMKQVLENAKTLSNKEKAMLAHCLIASLDQPSQDWDEQAWIDLAQNRFEDLNSGRVQPVSWKKLKSEIKA